MLDLGGNEEAVAYAKDCWDGMYGIVLNCSGRALLSRGALWVTGKALPRDFPSLRNYNLQASQFF
jgi:hypothetical protein